MVSIRVFIQLVYFLVFLSSCAKTSYLWNQGWGQYQLLNRAVENKKLLEDPQTSREIKSKIQKIERYKKYFYKYWEMEPTGIYSKTTLLDQEAVTYLVIASKYDRIRAKEECFPFMGCFPYLGFFSKKSAEEHAKKLSNGDWETFIRPVYAYSTLGYFEDTILSSFFYYEEFGLAELIFHELFHTLFFIDDEVDLNEALASYFSRQMAFNYFSYTTYQKNEKKSLERKLEALNVSFVKSIKELNKKLEKSKVQSKNEANLLRKKFFKQKLMPKMERMCKTLGIEKCFPLIGNWNNARMAAFMTYQERGGDIAKLHSSLDLNLKEFFVYIKNSKASYDSSDINGTFSDYLFKTLIPK